MKNKIKTFVFCGLLFLWPFLLPNLLLAQPVLDQSFTSPNTAMAFINECCAFIAQTFTAGVSGTLDGVNIDVASNNNTYPLHVAIHTVTISGEPSSTILGDTTLSPNSAPLSLLITFPQRINIAAGVQYAIVVNYQGAPSPGAYQVQGVWYGAAGNYDYYACGDTYGSVDGSSWFSVSGGGTYADLHFQTYLTPNISTTTTVPPIGWSRTTSPYLLNSISGTTSNDVFAVGTYGVILHYDGTIWTQMNSGTSFALHDVWCNASDDVFAVGSLGGIFHYNGSTWSNMTTNVQDNLQGVWGSSATDVFAVGNNGTILHYDGLNWLTVPSTTTNWINSVWGNSATDVYAVGHSFSGSIPPDGVVLHYNGTDWSECYRASAKPLTDIWGTSPDDIWAVGTAGTIIHYNGCSWSEKNSGTNKHLSGVWGNAANNVFIVGSELFSGNGIVLHYDGAEWSEILNDVTNEFYGVWGMGGNEVFVVGGIVNSSGIILHPKEEETAITLSSFEAIPLNKKVVLKWVTESEIKNVGFNIYRLESDHGEYIKINDSLIPAQGSSTAGATYKFIDTNVQNRKTYYYKQEDIDLSGTSTMHGPVSAIPRLIYGVGK